MAGTEREAERVVLKRRPAIFDELLEEWQGQEQLERELKSLYDRYEKLLEDYCKEKPISLSSGGRGSQTSYSQVSLPETSLPIEEGEFKVNVTGLIGADGISIAINFEGKDGMVKTSTCRLRKGEHQVIGRVGDRPMDHEDIEKYVELARAITFTLVMQ